MGKKQKQKYGGVCKIDHERNKLEASNVLKGCREGATKSPSGSIKAAPSFVFASDTLSPSILFFCLIFQSLPAW